MIRLEPMDEATFQAWLEWTIRDYARENVESGNWLAGDTLERSEREFADLLPDGRTTAGHAVHSMVNEDGVRVDQ